MKAPPSPRFRFDNWLATTTTAPRSPRKAQACHVHPLLAALVVAAAALLFVAVARCDFWGHVRTWQRLQSCRIGAPRDAHLAPRQLESRLGFP